MPLDKGKISHPGRRIHIARHRIRPDREAEPRIEIQCRFEVQHRQHGRHPVKSHTVTHAASFRSDSHCIHCLPGDSPATDKRAHILRAQVILTADTV